MSTRVIATIALAVVVVTASEKGSATTEPVAATPAADVHPCDIEHEQSFETVSG